VAALAKFVAAAENSAEDQENRGEIRKCMLSTMFRNVGYPVVSLVVFGETRVARRRPVRSLGGLRSLV
jgi:hypothetical protein